MVLLYGMCLLLIILCEPCAKHTRTHYTVGTPVTITGGPFEAGGEAYRCRFGSAVVFGVVVSRSVLECDAPARPFPGPVYISGESLVAARAYDNVVLIAVL